MASTRPLTRDYKRHRHGQFNPGRWKEFGLGLGAGLLVALAVFAWQRNTMQRMLQEQTVPRPEPRAGTAAVEGAAEASTDDAAAQYDFYEMLPKFEVVVPEQETEVRRDLPAATIARPGAYVLQAGTFTRAEDAERVRAQLALAGISATVQRVAVDSNVWHRVRIGPLTDLAEVNTTRRKLQGMDIDPLVIRVGD